jgi:hypothetical protein
MVWDRLKASQVQYPSLLSSPPCLTEFTFEFIRCPVSPILSPSSRTFVELTPHQLAPTVGTLGIGIMNLTAFPLLANNNSQVVKIQIPFRTVNFQPHQSSFMQVFESMDQDMVLTIGSLNFCVRSLGSIRLSDPTKMGPSASEPETLAMSESSEGSSSKVNSPVSLVEAKEGKITGGNETMENFDLEVQLKNLMICHDDISDQSTDTWKMGLELFEDDNLIFSSHNSKLDYRYQILPFTR